MTGRHASMRERMLAGELYIADDPQLARESARAQRLSHEINTMDPNDLGRRRGLLTELLGAFGENSEIRPPCAATTAIRRSSGPAASRTGDWSALTWPR